MELKKIIKETIRQYFNESINNNIFYHGSKYPELKYITIDNDLGRQLFGYGFYVSPDEEESTQYYSLEGNTDGYLYKIITDKLNFVNWKEPVDNRIISKVKKIPNFMDLFYYKPNFRDLKFDDYEYEIGETTYYWDLLTDPLPKWAIDDNGKVGYFLTIEKNGDIDETHYGLKKSDILDFIRNNEIMGVKELTVNNPNIDIIIRKDELFDSFENLYWYLFLKLKSTKKASNFFKDMGIDAIYGDDKNINIINLDKIKSYKKKKINYKTYRKYLN